MDSSANSRSNSSQKRKSNDVSSKAPSSSSSPPKKAKFQQHSSKRPTKQSSFNGKKGATATAATNNKSKSKTSSTTTTDKETFASLVDTGKRVWNALRLKTNTTLQTHELVMELIPLVTGRAHALSLRHDASRVVQAALQFGSVEQRRNIVTELTTASSSSTSNAVAGKKATKHTNSNHSGWLELCQSQYAHFVVLKVLAYCHMDADCWNQIGKAFQGHVAKLAVHATASKVMEALFLLVVQQQSPSSLPSSQKKTAVVSSTGSSSSINDLFLELYGPHVTLFGTNLSSPAKETTTSTNTSKHSPPNKSSRLYLLDHLERLPDKKDIILDFVRNLVHKGMEKQLYGFTYFQELLLEYCLVVPSTEIRTLAMTGADAAIHLLSAKAGTRVAAMWIAYGTAKERKRILRSLKGYIRSGLLHKQAYLAILRLVQLTDDTVSIHKNLLAELVKAPPESANTNNLGTNDSPLLEIALSDTASKVLLLVLMDEVTNPEGYQKLLDPYEHLVLFPNPTIVEQGVPVATSRKDPTVRRNEHVQYIREPLVDMCCKHATILLRSIPGSAVLKEVYSALDRPSAMVQALLEACLAALDQYTTTTATTNEREDAADTKSKETFLFEDMTAHRAVKALILVDAARVDTDQETGLSLASQMVERLTLEQWMIVANSNRGAFVVAAVGQIVGLRSRLVAKLALPELQRRKSAATGSTAGWEALFNVLST